MTSLKYIVSYSSLLCWNPIPLLCHTSTLYITLLSLITSPTDISDLNVGKKITLAMRHSVVDCVQHAADKVKGQAQVNKLMNDPSSIHGRECPH